MIRVQQTPVGLASTHANKESDPALEKLAKDFEGVFVRQLLEASHIDRTEKKSGYGAMVIDALSTAVERGGGLGLAEQIQKVLASADRAAGASRVTERNEREADERTRD